KNGTLFVSRRAGLGSTSLFYDSYDAAACAWVRVRMASGDIVIEVSPDGETWDEIASEAADTNSSFDSTGVVVTVGSAISLTADPSSTLLVQSINPCPLIDTLVEEFDSGLPDTIAIDESNT